MNTTTNSVSQVKYNEYPNAPWNTTPYEKDAIYEPCTPEWFAQQTAKYAEKIGLQYNTFDKYADIQELANAPYRKSTSTPAPDTQAATARADVARASLVVKNGVLTDSHLYMMKQGKLHKIALPYPLETAGHIMQMCLDYGLDMIAVLAPTELSARATPDYVDSARGTFEVSHVQYTRKKLCYFLSGWKKKDARATDEKGNTVSVFYAAHNTDWTMQHITDPVTLLATLTYIEDALQYPVRFKPSHVGRMLMMQENEGQRTTWTRPARIIENEIVCKNGCDDILWKRPLTEEEHEQNYVLAYDKNMQYTASCTSALLGAGDPTHVTRPVFDIKKIVPGLWKCNVSGSSDFDGVTLPHPTDGRVSGVWLWTYSVKLLHEVGYTVDIEEAYIWQESHTTLRPFAERVWNARNALRTDVTRYPHSAARAIAEKCVKSVANHSIGLLNTYPKNTDSEAAYNWFRPDWRSLLIDNARYQMFWRIRSYLKFGYAPIGIHVDCLYYTSNDSNHETALSGTTTRKGQEIACSMMERARELGGYKQKHIITIARADVEPLFNDVTLDMATLNAKLLTHEKETLAATTQKVG